MTENQVYVNGVCVGTQEDFNNFAKGVSQMVVENIEEVKAQEASPKSSQKEYFERFKNIYNELYLLNQDLKQLSDDFKEDHHDADLSNIKAVAKLTAEDALGTKIVKTEAFLEAVDTFTGENDE